MATKKFKRDHFGTDRIGAYRYHWIGETFASSRVCAGIDIAGTLDR